MSSTGSSGVEEDEEESGTLLHQHFDSLGVAANGTRCLQLQLSVFMEINILLASKILCLLDKIHGVHNTNFVQSEDIKHI